MGHKKSRLTNLWLILLALLSLNSCKSKEEIKYEQYVIAGKSLYELHCGNCHGNDGQGLRALYPAITSSENLTNTAYLKCIIKNGTTGSEFNMPANKELYDIDIAEIITYMNDQWGETRKMVDANEVRDAKCENQAVISDS